MVVDLTLRWTVTILFTLAAAGCVYAAVGGHRTPRFVLGQLLHVLMAAGMVAMAWPSGAGLPTVAPMMFFLFATAWFLAGAAIDPDCWASGFYHAAMMFAMAWMYALMNGRILPGQAHGVSAGGHHHGAGTTGTSALNPGSVAAPPYLGAVNWLVTIGFGLAAVLWLYRYFVRRRALASGFARRSAELVQALLAAGMSIMFAVLL